MLYTLLFGTIVADPVSILIQISLVLLDKVVETELRTFVSQSGC